MSVSKSHFTQLPQSEQFNVVTHSVGFCIALLLCVYLVYLAISPWQVIAICILTIGSLLMYASSSIYHWQIEVNSKLRWQIIDHYSIFVLIACSYTAYVIQYMHTSFGFKFLVLHWILVSIGIISKFIFKDKLPILSTVIYLVLGWMVVFIYQDITSAMSALAVILLLFGGASYTIGVIFYLLEKPWWSHGVWHIFVMLGTIAHVLGLLV